MSEEVGSMAKWILLTIGTVWVALRLIFVVPTGAADAPLDPSFFDRVTEVTRAEPVDMLALGIVLLLVASTARRRASMKR